MPFHMPFNYPNTTTMMEPAITSKTRVEYDAPCPSCRKEVSWVVGLRRSDASSATSSDLDRGVLTYNIDCDCGGV